MYPETYNFQLMCMFQYTNTHTHRQEVPSANRRSQIKYTTVLSTGLFATSMYTQHVHHVCVEGARKLQSSTRNFTAHAFALRLLGTLRTSAL